MKHVFFLHSAITSIVAKSIIEEKKIEHKDCIIVTLYAYRDNIVSRYFKDIPVHFFVPKNIANQFFFQEWRKYFWINIKTGFSKFTFYTFHDQVLPSKYITSNFKCNSYYYIEEGIGSFVKSNSSVFAVEKKKVYESIASFFPGFNSKYFFDKKINIAPFLPKAFFIKLTKVYGFLPKLKGGYGISKDAFNFMEKRDIVDLHIQKLNDIHLLDAPIFVFDNLAESKICKLSTLEKILKKFMFDSQIKQLNIKFHPLQPEAEKNFWKIFFKEQNIKIHHISQSTVLEEVLLQENHYLIGFVSSLLFYNKTLGKPSAYSISLLPQIFTFENREIPDAYKEAIAIFSEKGVKLMS